MIKVFIIFLLLPSLGFSIVARVGNGNDGNDLEGFSLIKEGPIFEAHKKAVSYLQSLNTHGLAGLGNLLPELENNKFYMTKKNVSSQKLKELGAYEDSPEGFVYARTFSKSHSATRFFPIAKKLDQNQLIALHIHEALHRALPESLRENEEVVTKVTLLLTAPGTSYDNIREELQKVHPEFVISSANTKYPYLIDQSIIYGSFDNFFDSRRKGNTNFSRPVKRNYTVGTEFYPFKESSDMLNLGLGVESSYLVTEAENYFGAFSLMAKVRFFSKRSVELVGQVRLNFATDSEDSSGESIQGRDTKEIGLYLNKHRWKYNYTLGLDYISSSELTRTRDNVSYQYDVGSILVTKIKYLRKHEKYRYGAIAKLHSVQKFIVNGGAVNIKKGRNHFFSMGPRFEYDLGKDVSLNLDGHYLFNYKKDDRDFDQFGDLLGQSLGQWKLKFELIYRI